MNAKQIVGENIKKRRILLGISQEALAHESGIHRTYISGLERGIRNPTITVIYAIAKALKTKLAHLLDED